jgi:hypothetical protein
MCRWIQGVQEHRVAHSSDSRVDVTDMDSKASVSLRHLRVARRKRHRALVFLSGTRKI